MRFMADAYCQANRVNHPKNKFYFPILPVGCQECRYHKFSVRATKAKKHGIFIDLRTEVRKENEKRWDVISVSLAKFLISE